MSRHQPRALGRAIREARAAAEPATLLASVQTAWRSVAGARVASEATPVGERAGVVTVACSAATWAQELDLLQEELLEGVNEAVAPRRVEALRFVVGSGPRPSAL